MKTKNFGFENFAKPHEEETPTQETQEKMPLTRITRKKAKGETVAITIRFSREQWGRIHELARTEGTSLQELAIQGISKLFQERGLKKL